MIKSQKDTTLIKKIILINISPALKLAKIAIKKEVKKVIIALNAKMVMSF